MRVVAILLAAGSSRRFGADKLLQPLAGRPLLEHALVALAASPGLAETVVVTRPGLVLPALPPRCRVVVNPGHEEGMGASLRTGVHAAGQGADAYLVALADMPGVTPSLVAALLACHAASGKPIVVPVCRGRRGHPVLLGAALRDELLAVRGDVGAREILRGHPGDVAELPTEDEGVLRDVDLPSDLTALGDAP